MAVSNDDPLVFDAVVWNDDSADAEFGLQFIFNLENISSNFSSSSDVILFSFLTKCVDVNYVRSMRKT